MPRPWLLAPPVLACLVAPLAAAQPDPDPEPVVAALVKAYNAGEAKTMHGLLSPGFQKALPLEPFTKFLTQSRAAFGDLKDWKRVRSEGPWLVYRCQGEKQPCTLKVVVDQDGRVAGFQLGRAGADKAAADKAVAEVVKAYNAASAADLHRLLDDGFAKALPLDQLEPLLKKQREQSGTIQEWEQARVAGDWRLYRVRTQKRDFTLRVVVTADGRLSGLRFTSPLAMVLPAGPIQLADFKKRFQAAAEQTLSENHFPSIAAAFVKDDRVVWADGFGYANVAGRLKADEHTVYVTGSVLKVLVATAVMQLVEEGKLDLDAPVNGALKSFQVPNPFEKEAPLTLRHLLSHRGGVPNGGEEVPLWARQLPTPLEEMLRRKARVTTRPGEKTVYSNIGYSLLGYLVGQQSGKPLEQAMQERLFGPLGMTQTAFAPTPEMTEHLAIPYEDDPRQDRLRPTYRVRLADYPAGDLYATPADLARFLLLHLGGGTVEGRQLLRPESVKEMARSQYEKRAGGFGLGWVSAYRSSRPLLWHNGGVRGFSSYMAIDPERRLGVVVFANKFDPESDPLPDLALWGLELLDKVEPAAAVQ
jgi:CubicO group peptidase (beta-lactamase class C family)